MRSDGGDECERMTVAYRQGLGLAAVVAVQGISETQIVALAPGRDDGAAVEPPFVRVWCRRDTEAACIAAAARKALRRRPDDDAAALIQAAAIKLGVVVQTDDEIAAEAATVVARIALEMRRQQQSGELKSVNQAYRNYRLEAVARGERALRYDAWMQRYREDLVRQAAATLRQL